MNCGELVGVLTIWPRVQEPVTAAPLDRMAESGRFSALVEQAWLDCAKGKRVNRAILALRSVIWT